NLEIDPGQGTENSCIDGRTRGRTCRTDHDLAALEIVERLEVLGPETAGRNLRIEAAQPVERARIEFRIRRIDHRFDDGHRIDGPDHRAIPWCDAREITRRLERARARHVLDDDVGIARDMAAEMTNRDAQVEFEGRTRRIADDRLHGSAAI